MQYRHESFAGGSMYAVHLPEQIPPAGSPGGPPLPADYREFAGMRFDMRSLFMHVYKDADDLHRSVDWLFTTFAAMSKAPTAPVPKPPWEQ
jgi:hypothetical protein